MRTRRIRRSYPQGLFSLLAWVAALAWVFLVAGATRASGNDEVSGKVTETTVQVHLGGRCMLEYQHKPNPNKPYLRLLCTPGGVNILRDAPADHLHHHGLMFAVGVAGVDFWAETPGTGRQQTSGVSRLATSSADAAVPAPLDRLFCRVFWAEFGHQIRWTASDGAQLLLQEDRQITWHHYAPLQNAPPVNLLTWTSTLSAPQAGQLATLDGRDYFGLGMRFVADMDQGGRFFNADGGQGVEQTNAKRSRWCAYTANVGDRPVTVAMFDDPENARHPAKWFTMDKSFAYLSATLGLKEQPLEVAAEAPLRLRYGVALWDGMVDAEVIQTVYQYQFCRSE